MKKVVLLRSKHWHQLALVFAVALLVRLVYAFYLQKYFSGGFGFTTNDTSSYMDSFINLVNHGSYCFDLKIRDSCFYRLPTYPFFLGIQKYLLPDYYWISIAILQTALDAVSCCLAVLIAREIGIKERGLLIVALLFVFYPFTIFWIPIQGPEIVGTFLVILTAYLILCVKNERLAIVFSGLSLVLGVWSKQYIAALIPSMLFFFMARSNSGKIIRSAVFFAGVFIIGYSPWIVRNLINYGEPAVLMGHTNGVRAHMPDYNNGMFFVALFYENQAPEMSNITHNGKLSLPESDFSRIHRDEINHVASDAFKCGPSYRAWRDGSTDARSDDCDQLVADGFAKLTQQAKAEMPFMEYYRTAFESFSKGFFKTSFYESKGSSHVQMYLFNYRGFLIVLAVLTIFLVDGRRQLVFVVGVLCFWFLTLFVLCFEYRHLEMRYLLMADSLMLICSGLTISRVVSYFCDRSAHVTSVGNG